MSGKMRAVINQFFIGRYQDGNYRQKIGHF